MRIEAQGLTDTGLAREHNEDCFRIDADRGLFVVADGMGGHSFGEVASRISIDHIFGALDDGTDPESDDGFLRHSRALRSAIVRAQRGVIEAIAEDDSLRGMGTTVASLHVDGEVGAVAHVGDSRVYRLREGRLEQLTEDHTWVNEQVMSGYLSRDQARSHPLRNVVTRALGGEADVRVALQEVALRPGDLYLLCSDGLTAMLEDEEICEILIATETTLEEKCRLLVAAANDRGGADNITVILVSVGDESS